MPLQLPKSISLTHEIKELHKRSNQFLVSYQEIALILWNQNMGSARIFFQEG
jgi:hypothetical protein